MLSVVPRTVVSGALILALFVSGATAHAASETLTDEPSSEAYNFVSHYRVTIDAPANEVWPILIDFQSWMSGFEQSTVSGTPGSPGHVLRLYEGQDFMTQVTGVEPQKMLSVVNLPLTFNGEYGTGVGAFTLHEMDDRTEVSLTMSRRYTPAGEGFGKLKTTRQSSEFQARTRAMWQDQLLGNLKSIVEAGALP